MNDRDIAQMQAVAVGNVEREIIVLEAALRAAQLAADVRALDALIADELLFTGPDGRLGTKSADLAAHSSGVVRFRGHDPQELRVRAVGNDVRVVALQARLTVEVNGAPVSGVYRYTRVWARESNGPWRVVAGHVSEVPAPGMP
jgi:ketosteroid isomerase-like protein